jgi:hypothetical protein
VAWRWLGWVGIPIVVTRSRRYWLVHIRAAPVQPPHSTITHSKELNDRTERGRQHIARGSLTRFSTSAFFVKKIPRCTDSWAKAVSNMNSHLRRYIRLRKSSIFNFIFVSTPRYAAKRRVANPRYASLRRVTYICEFPCEFGKWFNLLFSDRSRID